MVSEMVRNVSKGTELVRAEPVLCTPKASVYLCISFIPSFSRTHLLSTSDVLGVGDTMMAQTDTVPVVGLLLSLTMEIGRKRITN